MNPDRLQAFHHWNLADIPLLLPALGLIAGIALMGAPCGPGFGSALRFGIPAALLGAGLLLRSPRLSGFSLFALLGCLALWLWIPVELPAGTEGDFRGKVVRVDDFGSTQRCVVSLDGGKRVLLPVYDSDSEIIVGDSLKFSGILLQAVTETTVPRETDSRLFALVNAVSARCLPQEGSVEILSEASGLDLRLYRARSWFRRLIYDSGVSPRTADFLIAVLSGDNRIDSSVREDFASAGLSHMLALSGTHVAVIALIVAFLFFPVEMAGFSRLRIVMALLCLWGYALFTGMSPSVVRAVIMASFVLLARIGKRGTNPVNALCAAAMLILLFRPASLFLLGFQLSFLAVAGILMLMPLRITVNVRNRWLRIAFDMILLPVSAVIATAPCAAWHFHSFPLWFLIANLPAALLLPLEIFSGVALAACSAAGLTAGWLVRLADGLYGLLDGLARLTASLPGAVQGEIYFSGWLLLPVYVGLFLLWLAWRTGRRAFLINGLTALTLALAAGIMSAPELPENEAYSWPTARGSNIVCRNGGRAVIYTDAAPKYFGEIQGMAEVRLRDFFGSRHIRDSVKVKPLSRATASEMAPVLPVPELLVTREFRGDILQRAAEAGGGRLILSPSIPPVRRKAYVDTLSGAGVAFDYRLL